MVYRAWVLQLVSQWTVGNLPGPKFGRKDADFTLKSSEMADPRALPTPFHLNSSCGLCPVRPSGRDLPPKAEPGHKQSRQGSFGPLACARILLSTAGPDQLRQASSPTLARKGYSKVFVHAEKQTPKSIANPPKSLRRSTPTETQRPWTDLGSPSHKEATVHPHVDPAHRR